MSEEGDPAMPRVKAARAMINSTGLHFTIALIWVALLALGLLWMIVH